MDHLQLFWTSLPSLFPFPLIFFLLLSLAIWGLWWGHHYEGGRGWPRWVGTSECTTVNSNKVSMGKDQWGWVNGCEHEQVSKTQQVSMSMNKKEQVRTSTDECRQAEMNTNEWEQTQMGRDIWGQACTSMGRSLQTVQLLWYKYSRKKCCCWKTIENIVLLCGGLLYCIHSIEFQKQGLLHAHILLQYHQGLHYSCWYFEDHWKAQYLTAGGVMWHIFSTM